ncbi:spore germination protein [Ureibacillus chungkukjangi]|uniref:GerAB/ArcD/ProY family transporter n=1 Tax=Ureibacillus chungkukjangi TaxID=1202712 RepID=UPI00203FE9AF|nr:endospore germination permease [Ureibacillus chungkukjangi]MCM3389873.1 spore germination protein [Ureibacillus chungkukjangi]
MEKAKISAYQLLVLIFLFEIGSAILVPLAIEAKQDAWLAVLIGLAGGCCLFWIYHSLYSYYPDIPLTEYIQRILGSFLGKVLAFFYVLYFMYIAARVLRDFGEMLIIVFYPQTPLFVMNALMVLVVVYTIRKGIEVLARAGELLFIFMMLIGISCIFLITVSGIIDISNLEPLLEEGVKPVIKTAFTQTLFFPFGEVIVFAMILPYLNQASKAMKTGILGLGLSGLIIALIIAMNISVLGINLISRSHFPLLSTIQTIEFAGFLQRLDITFMLCTVVAGFFKISLYFYASLAGTANLFKIKNSAQLAFPLGLLLLVISISIASNFSEHVYEGLQIVPLYLHLPFQVIIPGLLLIIAFFKNRKKQRKRDS